MPQALPLIFGAVISNIVGGVIGAIVGAIVATVGAQIATKQPLKPRIDDPGARVNVKGTSEPIPLVYGTRRVYAAFAQVVPTGFVPAGAPPVIDEVTGEISSISSNKFLNFILIWGEGEIDELSNLYFDDTLSTDEKYSIVRDGTPIEFFFAEHFVGTETQAASTSFLAELAITYRPVFADRLWSSEHHLYGIAYNYIRLVYDDIDRLTWPTGVPLLSADIRGLKILDVRTSLVEWSNNPALCIYDYLTNARYGRGIDPTELDTQSFIDAANYCDQEIFIQTSDPADPVDGITQARYACDALLSPDETVLDNLGILLSTCRGALVFSGGLYKLKLEKVEVSTFTFDEDNIVGGWNIQLESSASRVNRVHAQFRNKTIKYADDFAIVESATFLAADSNEILEAKIDFPATTDVYRARQLAGMVLRQSRYSLAVEMTCTIAGLEVEVFDVVSVTHETPGWVNQLFRVMSITLESDDQVKVQLIQYADDVYDLDNQNEEDSPPPTVFTDPRVVQPIVLFEAAYIPQSNGDGTTRYIARLGWATEFAEVFLKGFHLRWRAMGATDWNSQIINYVSDGTPYGQFHQHDLNLPAGISHQIELNAFNSLGVNGPKWENDLTPIPAVPVTGGSGGDEGGA